MHRLLITALACLISVSVYSQYDLTKQKNHTLKHMTRIESKVTEKFGEIEKQECINHEEWSFDLSGNVLEHITYYKNRSKWETKTVFQYDEKENLVMKTFQTSSVPLDTTIYEYNETDRLVKSTDSSNGTIKEVLEFKYDELGNIVSETHYHYGDIFYMIKYKYDNTGKKIEYILYNGEGSIVTRETYEYNVDGQLSKLIEYSRNNIVTHRHYKYDEFGNKIEYIVERIDAWGKTDSDSYVYINGYSYPDYDLMSVTELKNKELLFKKVYDDYGNIISETFKDTSFNKYYEYVYNHMGHYTKQTIYKDGDFGSKVVFNQSEFIYEYYD